MNVLNQQFVEFSTSLILALTVVLAGFLSRNYLQKKMVSYLFWSAGLWCFAAGVFEELLFSAGYYNEFLIATYLGIVALLVEFLALGSMQLLKGNRIKRAYYLYSIVTGAILLYVLATEPIGNILQSYVVFGNLPTGVIVASSMITFPAAALLIATAALTYKSTRNRKMLSIIAGVVIVTIAGSLYIAQFPSFLYYSEFIGILFLWLGFFDFKGKKNKKEQQQLVEGAAKTTQTVAGANNPVVRN